MNERVTVTHQFPGYQQRTSVMSRESAEGALRELLRDLAGSAIGRGEQTMSITITVTPDVQTHNAQVRAQLQALR